MWKQIKLASLALAVMIASGCERTTDLTSNPSQQQGGKPEVTEISQNLPMAIHQEPYGETADGEPIHQYLMSNGKGMTVSVLNLGAIVTSVVVPDRDGATSNVVLSLDELAKYEKNGPYFGAICGRYANRIAGGKFSIDGEEFTLAINNPPNHLHGGEKGFHHAVWHAEPVSEPDQGAIRLVLTYVSPDAEDGYPGRLKTTVTYALNNKNELHIDYVAVLEGDKSTVLNLTNHCYWNLASNGQILDHELQLFCDRYVAVDETGIPTGELKPTADSPMDFQTPQKIGSRIGQVSGGYDHCYVVSGETVNFGEKKLSKVARVVDPGSGRVMEIFSTEPGVQFYTGNFLDGSEATAGYDKHEAFCLECQHFPDSPNHPEFPTTLLKPGEVYTQKTVHRFTTE